MGHAGQHTDTFLGIRRSALLEITLFLLVALVADLLFGDGTRYWDATPHPFWLIIILVSAQYGTSEGLLASAFASAALLTLNLPKQLLGEDIYSYLFTVLEQPLMWFCMAVLVGELRMRHIRERDMLREQLRLSTDREETITADYHRIQHTKQELEVQVASQENTALATFKAAREIEKVHPDEVLQGVITIVNSTMRAKKFSMFLLQDDQLNLVLQHGWTDDDLFSKTFQPTSPLFQHVIKEQHVLSIANETDEPILGQEGVLVGPLVNQDDQRVIGMLKIDEMEFLDLSITSAQTLTALCDWIATTYTHALLYQSAQADHVASDTLPPNSPRSFAKQKAMLRDMASHIGFDLSMIVVRLENIERLELDQINRIPHAITTLQETILKPLEAVDDYDDTAHEYAVLLPGASRDYATLLGETILSTLTDMLPTRGTPVSFAISTQSLHAEKTEPKILNPKLFAFRLKFLGDLSVAADFPVHTLTLKLTKTDESAMMNIAAITQIGETLERILEMFLAEHPTYFGHRFSPTQYAVVLSAIPLEQATEEGKELLQRLQSDVPANEIQVCSSLHTASPTVAPQ